MGDLGDETTIVIDAGACFPEADLPASIDVPICYLESRKGQLKSPCYARD